MKTERKLYFGIGNPTQKYRFTYHNAGSLLVDRIINNSSLNPHRLRIPKHLDFEAWSTDSFIIARSRLFMNESGAAASRALNFFSTPLSSFVLLHDDSDLTLGSWKYEKSRGAAGHHGVLSVVEHLKTKDFYRLRLGIRTQPKKAGDFVLQLIPKENLSILQSVFDEIIPKVILKTNF